MMFQSQAEQLTISGASLGENTAEYDIDHVILSRFDLTPIPWNGPSNKLICSIRHRSRFLRVSAVEYPPRRPAPSAKINSNSGVAPPVTKVRINVKAESLKYVLRNRLENFSHNCFPLVIILLCS